MANKDSGDGHATLGGADGKIATGGAFPGFGGAPPDVAGAGAAGVAGTASRSDHTHKGVTSIATEEGLGPLGPGFGAVTISQRLKATWAVATPRFYAVDDAGGNDANAGFSDVSSAAAWAVRKKTIAGLAAIFPKMGAGRTAGILIGSGGQTYADSLDLLLFGTTGYAALSVRGTTTGAATAADFIEGGWVTATGMFAAGYNPIAAFSTTIVKCLRTGGGAPAFAAEPAIPCGARIRFDAATTTVALRNVVRSVIRVTGADTLYTTTALPAVPVGTDTFFLEMPGWTAPATTLWHANRTLTVIGGNISGNPLLSGLTAVNNFFPTGCFFTGAPVIRNGALSFSPTATFPGLANAAVGDCRVAGATTCDNVQLNFGASVFVGLVTVLQPNGVSMLQAFFAGGFSGSGGAMSSNEINSLSVGNVTIGNLTGGAPTRFLRAAGTAMSLAGMRAKFGQCTFVAGSAIGLGIKGMCDLINSSSITAVPGALTNEGAALTDVGVDFINGTDVSSGTRFRQGTGNLSNLTGANGDIRLAGGQILTWAKLAVTGIADVFSNCLIGPTGPLYGQKFSGVLHGGVGASTSYLADGGLNLAVNEAVAIEYPSSLCIKQRLRVFVVANNKTIATTCTLYIRPLAGALTVTTMQVTIPAAGGGGGAGTSFSDLVSPQLVSDGDSFALLLADAGADAGTVLEVTAMLEGPT